MIDSSHVPIVRRSTSLRNKGPCGSACQAVNATTGMAAAWIWSIDFGFRAASGTLSHLIAHSFRPEIRP
jgi:hypothetical protein